MPADAATQEARARLYLSRAQSGAVRDNPLAFYSGKATVPNSFTGNLALGVRSDGPGANLLDGVAPLFPEVVPCDEPTILEIVNLVVAGANVTVRVRYSEPAVGSDVYVLFNTTGQTFSALDALQTGPDEVLLTFPDDDDLPDGIYALRIMRGSAPQTCFAVRNSLFVLP